MRTLLRFAYAHVQMMLYRPFLHYISPRLSADRAVDERYYACAAAGISVSRNIIHIAMEIKNQALVVGPFWSMLYTEFFAVLTLVFYALENPEKQGSAEVYADAKAGRDMIANIAPRSFAADRISKSLDTLWDNLPDSIKSGKAQAPPSKKRPAPGPNPGQMPMPTRKTPSSSAKLAGASRISPTQRPSFDNPRLKTSQPGLSMNYPEFQSLDVSAAVTSPASGGLTTPTAHPSNQYIRTGQTAESPSLYKLDAMMFPSGDPFAYPNQPLIDLGVTVSTHAESNPSHIASVQGHQADSRNYYMAGLYGDIEGHLSE